MSLSLSIVERFVVLVTYQLLFDTFCFRSFQYRTADALLKDFELMKTNAVKFNGVTNPIALEAVSIYESVKNQIEGSRNELSPLEEAVDLIMSGKTKGKKQKSGKMKKSNSTGSRNLSSVGGMSVDLGDFSSSINLHGGSDDSDSDDSFDLGSL